MSDGRSLLGATENESENGSRKSCVSLPGKSGDDEAGTSCGERGTEDESENESGESDNWLPQSTGDRPRAMKPSCRPGLCNFGDRGSSLGENGAVTETVGGEDWNCLRKESVEELEEGREGGLKGSSIAESSTPLVWETGNDEPEGTAKSSVGGRVSYFHTGSREPSLETTKDSDGDGDRECDSILGGGDDSG